MGSTIAGIGGRPAIARTVASGYISADTGRLSGIQQEWIAIAGQTALVTGGYQAVRALDRPVRSQGSSAGASSGPVTPSRYAKKAFLRGVLASQRTGGDW